MIMIKIAKAASAEDVTIKLIDTDEGSKIEQGEKLAEILWDSLPAKTWDSMIGKAKELEEELKKELG